MYDGLKKGLTAVMQTINCVVDYMEKLNPTESKM